MDTLTKGEQRLFAKYWGARDLEKNDEFWEDAYQILSEERFRVSLPLRYNPLAMRMVLEKLDCPPGQCGICCKIFDRVLITQLDIERIIENTDFTLEYLKGLIETEGQELYIPRKDSCPFLKDNACTIHRWRPDTCYFWPFQEGKVAYSLNGKIVQQMYCIIMCRPSMEVVRDVITYAMNPDRLLLPNLTIISNKTE